MKIIEVIETLNDGGAESIVKNYALMLTEKGHEVIIVTISCDKTTANYQALNNNGIRVISIFPKENFFRKLNRRFNWRAYINFKLKRIIKTEKPDVIHIHLALLKYFYNTRKVLKNIKLFYTCHNLPERLFTGKRKNEMKIAKYLIKNNNLQIIALHEEMAKEINELLGISNTVVIRNAIDIQKFSNVQANKEKIRNNLKIPADAFVIGNVGRFVYQKNPLYLIDIFNEVYKKNNKAFLLLVGDGQLEAEIRNKLNDYGLIEKVLILSHRNDINNIMKAMDVFAFPTIFEGLGIVVIEAQIAGLKCVISDNVPQDAIITPNVYVLSNEYSTEQWADTILHDNLKYKVLNYGDLQNYNLEKVIENVEQLYFGNKK